MQQINSSHPQGAPGFSYGPGSTIVWDESGGNGARPETILRMVIERVEFLQSQLPCKENEEILNHLRTAVLWEEVRTRRREEQGVSGTGMAHQSEDGAAPLNPKSDTEMNPDLPFEAAPTPEEQAAAAEAELEQAPDDEAIPMPEIKFPEGVEPPPQTEAQHPEAPPPEPQPAPQPQQPATDPNLEVTEHPHPLDIAMPVQDGRFIPQAVLNSFEKQGIPYRLWVSTVYSNGQVANARNSVREFSLKGTAPYILMTDNDLVFRKGDFEAMVLWLERHPDFGAIAISKHGDPDPHNPGSVTEPTHVDAGPVMFRRSVYRDFAYSNKGGTCECTAMCRMLREEMGQRIGFLTGRTVQHIRNTRLDR